VKSENGKLQFVDKASKFSSIKKEIIISQIFNISLPRLKQYFLLTNLGIFIVREKDSGNLYITDFYLETTPGRLLFSINFKKSFEY
jgi:hypothetical protein